MIAQAVESELLTLLDQHHSLRVLDGLQAVVRHGYLPERTIQTGLGDVTVKVPKVRDRSGSGIRFTSALLPPYLKRAKSIEELLPLVVFERHFDWGLPRSVIGFTRGTG